MKTFGLETPEVEIIFESTRKKINVERNNTFLITIIHFRFDEKKVITITNLNMAEEETKRSKGPI